MEATYEITTRGGKMVGMTKSTAKARKLYEAGKGRFVYIRWGGKPGTAYILSTICLR